MVAKEDWKFRVIVICHNRDPQSAHHLTQTRSDSIPFAVFAPFCSNPIGTCFSQDFEQKIAMVTKEDLKFHSSLSVTIEIRSLPIN